MDAPLIPTFFCPKAWAGMSGNEATRFCSYCHKHVHNLDALSASERLALLSSPAAQLCARYKIAIRRPKPGRKESYARHLAKYGVGVALTGATVLVFWEMYARSHRHPRDKTHYRITTPCEIDPAFEMSDNLYDETQVFMLGGIGMPPKTLPAITRPGNRICSLPSEQAGYVDAHLDPLQVEQLLKPASPKMPAIDLAPLMHRRKNRK